MAILQQFFFFLFIFPIIHATTYSPQDCSHSTCGNTKFNISIRFPFTLRPDQPDRRCGYPGFTLGCNPQSITTLTLPNSGLFYVRKINYLSQKIYLYDPDNCLARRLLSNVSFAGSPFFAPLNQNYTFLSCPTRFTTSRLTTIGCLSNSTTSVLATSSKDVASSLLTSCKVITTLAVPVSWSGEYSDGFSTDFKDDLPLTWGEPDCGNCEALGGICGFKTEKNDEIGCSFRRKSGISKGFRVFTIICLTIAAPAVSLGIGIAFFTCCKEINCMNNMRINQNSNVVAASPEPTISLTGLDEFTIESYEKIILGESLRLSGPNDTSCPICLAEYCNKETLRCIPECKHCFHVDCIDEWLRMHNTCPVCRNIPSPIHEDV